MRAHQHNTPPKMSPSPALRLLCTGMRSCGVASPDRAAPCVWWQPEAHRTFPRRGSALGPVAAAARRSRSRRCGVPNVVALYKKDVASWLGAKSDTSDTTYTEQRLSPPPPQPRFSSPSVSLLLSNWFDWLPGVTFSCLAADVDPGQLHALWSLAGLYTSQGKPVAAVAAALKGSHLVVSAFTQPATPQGQPQLIGCARTLWDGAFVSLLVDCAVHPDWRERGIEGALLRRILRPAAGSRAGRPPSFACVPADECMQAALAGQGFKTSRRNVFLTYTGTRAVE